MKLNKEYYDLSKKNMWFKGLAEVIPLNNENTPLYPFNKPLDNSIAYAMTKGKYSPFCDWSYVAQQKYTYSLTGEGVYGVHRFDFKEPMNYLFLATSQQYYDEPMTKSDYMGGTIWGGLGQYTGISVGQQYGITYHSFARKSINDEQYSFDNGADNWGYDNPNIYAGFYSGSLCSGFVYNKTIMLVRVSGYNHDFTETYTNFFDVYDFKTYPNIGTVDYQILNVVDDNGCRLFINDNLSIACKYEGAVPIIKSPRTFFGDEVLETEKGYSYGTFNNHILCGGIIQHSDNLGYSTGQIDRLPHFSKIHSDMLNYSNTILYYAITKEELAKVISCCGLLWTGSEDVAKKATLGNKCHNEYIRLPIQNNEGYFVGEYVTGKNIPLQNNINWGETGINDWFENNGVTNTPDINNYVEETPLNSPALTSLNTFNRTFALNKEDVKNLSNFLWNSDESIFNQIVKGLALMGENPINSLIDLRLYPFDTRLLFDNNNSENIVVGRTPTNIQGLKVDNNKAVLNFGECDFPKYFNNFLDYEPFTYAELVIPYFGKISITPSEYCGHKISLKLVVDFTTGAAMACIFSDGILKEQKNGVIGVEISLTSDNSAQIASNFLNVFSNSFNTSMNFAGNVASGAIGGDINSVLGSSMSAVGGVVSHNIDSYQNFHKATPIQNSGCNTPTCSLYAPQYCYLIIHSPIIKEPENYKETIGYACEYTSKLSELTGYTICHNVNFDGGYFGTAEEMTEIKRLLEGGVYL